MSSGRVDLSPVEQAYAEAHEHYLNHILRCSSCYAPNSRYCAPGRVLQTDSEARYLMTLPIDRRRTILTRREFNEPGRSDVIKARMLEIHNQTKATEVLSDE